MARTLSPFPPIASYAFLSDCEVCALVAPTGNVEWMCLPRFDGPSIFGALLDRDAGLFKVAPSGHTVPAWRLLPARHDGAEEQTLSLEQPLSPVSDIRPRGISWTR